MMKYPIHAHDPYIDKAPGVLCHRLGIADQAELSGAFERGGKKERRGC